MYCISCDFGTKTGGAHSYETPATNSIIHATNQLEAFQEILELLCSSDVVTGYTLCLNVIPSYCR